MTNRSPKSVNARPTRLPSSIVPDFEPKRGAADSYTLYLREIGETPLLTPAEEYALAHRVLAGDKEARDQMIRANLRLVVKIARDYENIGMPLLDLINEGNIGLMKGVDRFDPERGAKISTYCAWWIKQHIRRALANQSKTIRLPVHVVDKVSHLRRATMKLHGELGREPTDEDLSDALGYSLASIKRYRMAGDQGTSSLDAPLGDEGDSNALKDIVQDEKASTPFEQLNDKVNVKLVRDLLHGLDPREQEILKQRFGLDSDQEKTLEEIGKQLGVTRERIRQVQNVALEKLRKKMEALDHVEAAA